jgi:hypothetical protein
MFPQPMNELSPIAAPDFTLICEMAEHPWNAHSPMELHLLTSLFVNAEQPKNA